MNIFQKFLNLIGLKQQAAVATTPEIEAQIKKVEDAINQGLTVLSTAVADAEVLATLLPQAAPIVATINGLITTFKAGVVGAEGLITAIEQSPVVTGKTS